MGMQELTNAEFVRHCEERHCFFYSHPRRDCLFARLTLGQVVSYCRLKQISIEMVFDSINCPEPTKEVVSDYKMGKLLLGEQK